jgi:hypothetical protein
LVDHHWLRFGSGKAFVPDSDKFGFVYIITNLRNGKAYIGCKQYIFYTRLREKESDWRTYTGSSKLLNEDIEKIGKKHFKFEAIAEYKNKRSLRYYELYYQMKYNVLAATLEGSEEHAYYNSRVGGKFYRPVESYEDPEYRKKLREREFYQDPERRLYLAVIGRALLDIIRDPSKNAQTYREDVIIKDRATAWFFCSIGVTCDNFEFICEGAGIDPSVVRSFAYTVIHSEDKKEHIYSIYNSSKE